MRFSDRSRPGSDNALTRALREARAGGHRVLDLTASNPTTANIPYAEAEIRAAISPAGAMTYAPEALGLEPTRAEVSRHYASLGVNVPSDRIAITASTSEAYAALFKVLCDPGDRVLVPAPSYPLLDMLAQFESVELVRYPLVYAGGWHVDIDTLRSLVDARTRAVVVVNPNNPTGQFIGAGELEAMIALGLPILSDEVFGTFAHGPLRTGRAATALVAGRGLVFALSGLSKLALLPQLKLAWIAAAGDRALVDEAIARLDLVLDAYLSVATPIQLALPAILASRDVADRAVKARLARNLGTLHATLRDVTSATVLDCEAGFYGIVRVPETQTDEAWALELVARDQVYLHPGYFFDIPRGAHLIVSLLTEEPTFAEGIRRVAARIAALD